MTRIVSRSPFGKGSAGDDSQPGSEPISTTTTTLLVAQSGGPTVVINASLVGIIEAARGAGARVLGSRWGIEGVLADELLDLSDLAPDHLARLRNTPSAALGTSRHRPDDAEIARLLERFGELGITAFTPIGGNDTAETALRLSQAARDRGQPLAVVAVPKTIDNDLPEMDHCPGYGSIARYTALAVRDSAFDTRSMARIYPIKIVEVMGRNAGWLAASASLAFAGLPRPLICLPERPLAGIDALAEVAQSRVDADGYVVIVAPETMKWADGRPVAGDEPVWVDAFGHRYFPSSGEALARELRAKLDLRARYDRPGTIARMAMLAASTTDLAEAQEAGHEAARRALSGESGTMVTIERIADEPYQVGYGAAPLARIAARERRLDEAFIAPSGLDVTPAFERWARPLLGDPLPEYEVLA